MKLFLLIIVSVCLPFISSAQKGDAKNAEYYESLIKNGDSCNIRNYISLVSIYNKERNTEALKKTLKQLKKCPLKDELQRGYYSLLADTYFKEGEFRKTLDLMALSDSTEHLFRRHCSMGRYIGLFSAAVRRFECYRGLNLADKAIEVLTPYMFYQHSYYAGSYDSLAYNDIVDRYLELLKQRYSIDVIRSQLQGAKAGFYYCDLAENKTDRFGPYVHHHITCGFLFFGKKITYLDLQTINRPGNFTYDSHSEQYQYNYFIGSPLYRKIMSLK